MEPADLNEVFKRLAERGHKYLDERYRPMPLPEGHWGPKPVFLGDDDAVRKQG